MRQKRRLQGAEMAILAAMACQLVLLVVQAWLALDSNKEEEMAAVLAFNDILQSAAAIRFSAKRRRLHNRWSSLPRPLPRFDQLMLGHVVMDDAMHRKYFGMSHGTFRWFLDLVGPHMTKFRHEPASARVAVGLFRLATGAAYLQIARLFDVSEATAFMCTKDLCDVLCVNFKNLVSLPSTEEMQRVARSFELLSGLPNCCGAVGAARFVIKRPTGGSVQEYLDTSRGCSLAAQLVVDSSLRIIDISVHPGGFQASRFLQQSELYKGAQAGKVLNGPRVVVEGVDVPPYLVGDSEYQLLPWLLVPYPTPMLTHVEDNFNRIHSVMCSPSKRAIAALKKWGILCRPMSVNVSGALAVIDACAIIHNMLVERNELIDVQQPAFTSSEDSFVVQSQHLVRDKDWLHAESIRNALVVYLHRR